LSVAVAGFNYLSDCLAEKVRCKFESPLEEYVRNWNTEFQLLLERCAEIFILGSLIYLLFLSLVYYYLPIRPTSTPEEAKERSEAIEMLSLDFVEEASKIVKLIISERSIPDHKAFYLVILLVKYLFRRKFLQLM
jgi:hypothetical protein